MATLRIEGPHYDIANNQYVLAVRAHLGDQQMVLALAADRNGEVEIDGLSKALRDLADKIDGRKTPEQIKADKEAFLARVDAISRGEDSNDFG